MVLAWSISDNECVLAQLTSDNTWHCQCFSCFDYFVDKTGISHWGLLPEKPADEIFLDSVKTVTEFSLEESTGITGLTDNRKDS